MSSYPPHSAETYRERDPYRSRDGGRDRDRDWNRNHEWDRDRNQHRARDGRSRSRSRSPDRTRPRDRESRARPGPSPPHPTGHAPPRDPRVRAKESPYEDSLDPGTADGGSPTDRIVSDIMPIISTEVSTAPQSRIATLLRRLIKATAEEEKYKTRADELERRNAAARKLADHFRHHPAPADFRDFETERNSQALISVRASLAAAEKRVKTIPKELADEISKITAPTTSTPDFEARFEALEKTVSQERSARVEEAKSQESRIAALEETNQSLEETVKALRQKIQASEKTGSAVEQQMGEASRERSRMGLYLKSLEKLVKSMQGEIHSVKREIDTQQGQLDAIREKVGEERTNNLSATDIERLAQLDTRVTSMEQQLADVDIPGIDKVVAWTLNFNAEFRSIEDLAKRVAELERGTTENNENIKGLTKFDEGMIVTFGGMVDKLNARVKSVEGREYPAQDDSTQVRLLEPVWTKIQEFDEKLVKVKGGLDGNQDALNIWKAKCEQLSSVVDRLQKQHEAIEFSLKSLDSRWDNMYTTEFAERVIGHLEKLYPHPQQLQQDVQDISNRLKNLEARAQLTDQDQGQMAERNQMLVFGNSNQNY